ncbi:MAG: hypothetical protein H7Z74_01315 [Anaerolineae bacterium]|nr:hypothetical protein [Gemmatimonadaceae bacterium]
MPTRPACPGRRNTPRCVLARVLAVVVLSVPAVMLVACGDEPIRILPDLKVDTTTFAGRWEGVVSGSGGDASLVMTLNADSTYSGEGGNPFYCNVIGTWTVSGGQFTSTGRACNAAIVTSVAPSNKTRLTGTWSATNGTSGTFNVAKQPEP